jgi:hypothetical protein
MKRKFLERKKGGSKIDAELSGERPTYSVSGSPGPVQHSTTTLALSPKAGERVADRPGEGVGGSASKLL